MFLHKLDDRFRAGLSGFGKHEILAFPRLIPICTLIQIKDRQQTYSSSTRPSLYTAIVFSILVANIKDCRLAIAHHSLSCSNPRLGLRNQGLHTYILSKFSDFKFSDFARTHVQIQAFSVSVSLLSPSF